MPFEDGNNTHRRQSDHSLDMVEEKIISLIEQTDSTKDKAYLLILMKLNDSVTTNTNNTNKVANKLKEIVENMATHEALLNRSKGWRDILVWVLGIVQTVGILIMVNFNSDLENIRKELVAQKVDFISHQSAENGLPIKGR